MTKQIRNVNLNTDEAIVLQQIYEDIEDDPQMIARQVGMSYKWVLKIVAKLKSKGLLVIEQTCGDLWIRLSSQGRRLVQNLWPEAQLQMV